MKQPSVSAADQDLFEHLYRTARQILHAEKYLAPVVFLRTPGALVPVQMEMPANDAGKDTVARALRHLVKTLSATSVLTIMESWMVQPNPAEAKYYQSEGAFPMRPSQHPNRIEIVLFVVHTPQGSHSAWVKIERDAAGQPSIPATPPTLEHYHSEGRFANLFQP